MWWLYLLCSLAGVIFLLIAILLIRTLAFKPKFEQPIQQEVVEFDKNQAVKCLQSLVQCKTISDFDKSNEDDAEFEKLINLLPTLYPNVYAKTELKTFGGRSLMFIWKGKTDKNPSVFMSHYDVVSVEEDKWDKPPFAGIIEDDVLWGRGTLDTKATFNAALFAVNHLIGQGFTPDRDVYLCFSGSEEVNGSDAYNMMNYFKENSIELEMVIDEGGAVVNNVFPGVNEPCALVGIAEKGMMNVKYTVNSNGGHASAPKPNSPLVVLANAVKKLDKNPFKMHITEPVKIMLDTLGRKSTFLYRMIFANMWLFKGLLDKIARMSGGELNSLFRTTIAITQAEGSKGINVIPPVASISTNMRLNPMDSVNSATKMLKKTINNDKIDIKILASTEPSRISKVDALGFERIKTAIKATWDNVLVSPYLMVQCSDCRHYGEISDRVYRFSAMAMTKEERNTVHGNNERIRLSQIEKSVEFYIRLIKSC